MVKRAKPSLELLRALPIVVNDDVLSDAKLSAFYRAVEHHLLGVDWADELQACLFRLYMMFIEREEAAGRPSGLPSFSSVIGEHESRIAYSLVGHRARGRYRIETIRHWACRLTAHWSHHDGAVVYILLRPDGVIEPYLGDGIEYGSKPFTPGSSSLDTAQLEE